jgi:hypothetical protein
MNSDVPKKNGAPKPPIGYVPTNTLCQGLRFDPM